MHRKYVLITPQVNSKKKEEKMWRWQKYSKIRKVGMILEYPLFSKQLSIEVQLTCDVAGAETVIQLYTQMHSLFQTVFHQEVAISRYTSLSHCRSLLLLCFMFAKDSVSVNPKFLTDPSP